MCPCLMLCRSGPFALSLSKGRIIPSLSPGLFLAQQRHPVIHCAALFLAHLHPAGNLIEGAQTTAAHVIPQRRRAMTQTGRLGSNFGRDVCERRTHGAIIAPAWFPAPIVPAKSALAHAIHRTSRGKVATCRKRQGAPLDRTPCSAIHRPIARTVLQRACR
jgi:hypothetical protein